MIPINYSSSPSYVLVFDLGMRTLNLTILLLRGGLFHTVTSHTFYNVGGKLFDEAIATHLADEFERCRKRYASVITMS